MIEVRKGPNSSLLLRPSDNLDWLGASALRDVIIDGLARYVDVVIDLRRVKYIDAVGVSALLGSLRRARAIGGNVRVVNSRPAVRNRLQLVGVCPGLLDLPFTHSSDDAA